MNTPTRTPGSVDDAQAMCAAAGLSEGATQMLMGAPSPRTFVESLAGQEAYEDAIAFLAHALPHREAVRWAWLCARDAVGEEPPAGVAESLEATEAWIDDPADAFRRAAFTAAEAAGFASPVGLAGLAAFLCGETLGPPDAPPSPPPPFAAAKAIVGCIHLAAAVDGNEDIGARYGELIRRGLEVADSIDLWPQDESRSGREP